MWLSAEKISWLDEILDYVEPSLGIYWTKEDDLETGNEGRSQ